jgi:outer membrane protein OmpA-like peptidoglycan-associated protein
VNARNAYARASAGAANQWAPAELHKAKEALALAEQSFADDPNSFRTRDLAYVAERKAELSETLAASAAETAMRQRAEADYAKAQGKLVAQSQKMLAETRQQLAENERNSQKTAAELDAERQARMTAEQQAADADKRVKEMQEQIAKLAAVREEPRGTVITLSGSVLFPSNSAVLLPEAETRLGQVADALLATKEHNLSVEGYTDSRGSDDHNIVLSQQRAEAVRSFLVARGYEPDRVVARGFGKAKPIADNHSPEGRANNRRVEIVIEPMR